MARPGGLMIAIGKPKGDAGDDGGDEEDAPASERTETEGGETTKAQRVAGAAFAAAVKSGDGEAVWSAFAELCALHADEEEGESEY